MAPFWSVVICATIFRSPLAPDGEDLAGEGAPQATGAVREADLGADLAEMPLPGDAVLDQGGVARGLSIHLGDHGGGEPGLEIAHPQRHRGGP